MATVYGVNATKNNTPSHQNVISGNEYNARVRWMHDSYEASSLAAGSAIKMGTDLPAGTQILPGSIVYHDALGANTELAVGTAVSGTQLAAAEATTAAGNIALCADVDKFGTALTSDSGIYLTATSSGTPTGTIRLSLMYANV